MALLFSSALLFSTKPASRAELYPADSLSRPEYIFRRIKYGNTYSFIDYRRNVIQWQQYSAVSHFFNALKFASYKKVKVLHFGDSHVQADIATGTIRNRLQDVFGNGGRGIFFPYACIRSHSGNDNYTYATGIWDYSKNTNPAIRYELGLTGATARTTDPHAGFRIIFNKFYREMNNTVLKIYCRTSLNSFDLRLRTDVTTDPILISCKETTSPYVTVYLPAAPKMLNFEVVKNYPAQTFFEIHGISLEQPDNSGIVYNSMGINGASLSSIIRQNLMDGQIRDMQPDLIVFDLGGNDFFAGGINEAEYESKLRLLVDRFRNAAPNASILLVPPQDIYRFGRYCVTDCKKAAEITARVAFTSGCAYYDYYRVAGGTTSMLRWHQEGLAKNDKIHLTYSGYVVKGELYANAILNAFYHTLSDESKGQDSPIPADSVFTSRPIADATRRPIPTGYPSGSPSSPTGAVVVPDANKNATYRVSAVERQVYHTVRPGETLGKISQQYHVSVAQLMQWNRLPSTWIRAGDRLLILTRVKETTANTGVRYQGTTESAPKTETPASVNTAAVAVKPPVTYKGKPLGSTAPPAKTNPATQAWGSKKIIYYEVKSGDNLWLIAQKFNTTVDAIKRANNLYSDRLSVGQKLVIK
jgi:LysM repeat protein